MAESSSLSDDGEQLFPSLGSRRTIQFYMPYSHMHATQIRLWPPPPEKSRSAFSCAAPVQSPSRETYECVGSLQQQSDSTRSSMPSHLAQFPSSRRRHEWCPARARGRLGPRWQISMRLIPERRLAADEAQGGRLKRRIHSQGGKRSPFSSSLEPVSEHCALTAHHTGLIPLRGFANVFTRFLLRITLSLSGIISGNAAWSREGPKAGANVRWREFPPRRGGIAHSVDADWQSSRAPDALFALSFAHETPSSECAEIRESEGN